MSWTEIALIVFGVVTLLAGVSWVTLIKKFKGISQVAIQLKDDYYDAIADGTITDLEKARMGEQAIYLIENAIDAMQILSNLWLSIRRIVIRR